MKKIALPLTTRAEMPPSATPAKSVKHIVAHALMSMNAQSAVITSTSHQVEIARRSVQTTSLSLAVAKQDGPARPANAIAISASQPHCAQSATTQCTWMRMATVSKHVLMVSTMMVWKTEGGPAKNVMPPVQNAAAGMCAWSALIRCISLRTAPAKPNVRITTITMVLEISESWICLSLPHLLCAVDIFVGSLMSWCLAHVGI